LTVADVLSTAGAPAAVAAAATPTAVAAAAAPAAAAAAAAAPAAAAAAAPTATLAAADAGTHHDVAPTAVEILHSEIADLAQHFHHMWG
jgi:hypothetical protein